MKKILTSLGVSLSACVIVATPVSFAEDSTVLASDLVSALENTLESDFSASAQLDFTLTGSNEDYSVADISYTSGALHIQKSKKSLSLSSQNEVLSVDIDKIDTASLNSEDFLFPFHLLAKGSGNIILDFDEMKFVGKFHNKELEVKDNARLKNVTDGILELLEPFENKWIALDLGLLAEEFPDVLDDLDELRSEIDREFLFALKDGQREILIRYLAKDIEAGLVTVKKKNNTYTLSGENSDFFRAFNAEDSTLTLTLDTKDRVSHFSLNGTFTDQEDEFLGTVFAQSTFVYTDQEMVWPVLVANDWEVTKVLRMFMEFAQAEENARKMRNVFWYNLEKDLYEEVALQQDVDFLEQGKYTGDLRYALITLLNSEYRDATRLYLQRYPDVSRIIGARDVFLFIRKSGIVLERWNADEIRRVFSFSSPVNSDVAYDIDYLSQSKGEVLLSTFINERYSYQPYDVNIDEEAVYQLDTRKDFLIFLAKGLQAQKNKY